MDKKGYKKIVFIDNANKVLNFIVITYIDINLTGMAKLEL